MAKRTSPEARVEPSTAVANTAMSRTARKAAALAAAAAQADADALARSNYEVPPLKPGVTPSLHEQNVRARATNKSIKNIARDAAKAAGEAAFKVLSGKQQPGAADTIARRHRTMATAQVSMAKAAQIAAHAAEQEQKTDA